MRRWAGRIVFVIAVLACIATSRRRWHLEAPLPHNVPLTLPADGSRGLLLTVEHSDGDITVDCHLNGRNVADANPRAPSYLCPPGATLRSIALDGHDGDKGCGDVKVPDSAYARVKSLDAVEVWTLTIERTFDVVISSTDGYGTLHLELSPSPEAADFTAALGPDEDVEHFAAPERSGGRDRFNVTIAPRGVAASGQTVKIKVTIRAFGTCPKPPAGGAAAPCEPPQGDAAPQLSRVDR